MNRPPGTYILASQPRGNLYIGATSDLIARLYRRHRQWRINLIEESNPYWQNLAVGFGFPPLDTRPADHGC